MNKLLQLSLAAALFSTAVVADQNNDNTKRILKGSMQEKYLLIPQKADNLLEMFTKANWYARLRSNTFVFDYQSEKNDPKDHIISGLGGSFIYKTAPYQGFSVTAGAYYSHGFTNKEQALTKDLKAGKGAVSRYNVMTYNSYDLFSLAQYFVQYDAGKTEVKVGQHMFESLLTKSNDTKMMPNSFMGISVQNTEIEGVVLRAYYFLSQKLRDHDTSHDFVTFGDGTNSSVSTWNNNDDSAVNKALTYAKLKAAGVNTDHDMNGMDVTITAIEGLKVTLTHNMVPEIVLHEAGELTYAIKVGDIKVIPGTRIILQKGLTAPKITQIANLKADTSGYTNPDSLSTWLGAGKIDVEISKALKFRYGISYIADMADVMAMWRGFPTAGYTRAMAQYNWSANTLTNMVRMDIDLDKMGVWPGSKFLVRFAIQNFDETKSGVQGDTNVIHFDATQSLDALTKGLTFKFRVGIAMDARNTALELAKSNAAYNEYRFEFNYLF